MSCTKSVTTEPILAFSKLVPDLFEQLKGPAGYDKNDGRSSERTTDEIGRHGR